LKWLMWVSALANKADTHTPTRHTHPHTHTPTADFIHLFFR
jgi:hypothetical protein